ncbi:hypothetical protein AUC71_12925 [Methyloceanibacter marginalis]|uniref:Uncharacterized protein n=1 Tax=Methyloceanibacter marginalis TaxID=1774971 RepID=A0A1E3WAW3_9HYPH|nr:hypothetical protein AUC71_12925 [Methyloceanibacter marginalis]
MRRETNGSMVMRLIRNQEIGLNLVCGSRAICAGERDRQQSAARLSAGWLLASPRKVSRHGVAYGCEARLRGFE